LLEITQRCNLNCAVCYANAGDAGGSAGLNAAEQAVGEDALQAATSQDPSIATIDYWYGEIKRRAGICHIQLSGGEPTLRNDLCEIIQLGKRHGFSYFQLNTNGIRLAKDARLAGQLKAAGLTTVFLQFDGIDDEVYAKLRNAELLSIKEQVIAACAKAKLPVVLVPTVVRGINDKQLYDIVRFGMTHSPTVRGVHFQPITLSGRCDLSAAAQEPQGCCDKDTRIGLQKPLRVCANDYDLRITIPELLEKLEYQSGARIQAGDFSGGGAEHQNCSFNANFYIAADGNLKRLAAKPETAVGVAVLEAAGAAGSRATAAATSETTGAAASETTGVAASRATAASGAAGVAASETTGVAASETIGVVASRAIATSSSEVAAAAASEVATLSDCCDSAGVLAGNYGSCCSTTKKADSVARAQDIQRSRWGIKLDTVPLERPASGSLDEAYWQATTRAFAITGMAFMDLKSMNIDRLRRCYIFVVNERAMLIPFCAYNLSGNRG
jgi:organic radical activating enzyme